MDRRRLETDDVIDKVGADVRSLNTPNSANLKDLFKRYLDLRIENIWKWRGTEFDQGEPETQRLNKPSRGSSS